MIGLDGLGQALEQRRHDERRLGDDDRRGGARRRRHRPGRAARRHRRARRARRNDRDRRSGQRFAGQSATRRESRSERSARLRLSRRQPRRAVASPDCRRLPDDDRAAPRLPRARYGVEDVRTGRPGPRHVRPRTAPDRQTPSRRPRPAPPPRHCSRICWRPGSRGAPACAASWRRETPGGLSSPTAWPRPASQPVPRRRRRRRPATMPPSSVPPAPRGSRSPPARVRSTRAQPSSADGISSAHRMRWRRVPSARISAPSCR